MPTSPTFPLQMAKATGRLHLLRPSSVTRAICSTVAIGKRIKDLYKKRSRSPGICIGVRSGLRTSTRPVGPYTNFQTRHAGGRDKGTLSSATDCGLQKAVDRQESVYGGRTRGGEEPPGKLRSLLFHNFESTPKKAYKIYFKDTHQRTFEIHGLRNGVSFSPVIYCNITAGSPTR